MVSMRYVPVLFLIPLVFLVSDNAYADIYRGPDYQTVTNPDGSHIWTGGLEQWILDNTTHTYKQQVITTNSTHVIVDSKIFPFAFNKNTCVLTIYDSSTSIANNPVVLVGKEYWSIAKKNLPNGIWQNLDPFAVSCTYNVFSNATGQYLQVTRDNPSIGTFVTTYGKSEGKLVKPSIVWTNKNGAWTNTSFAFTDNLKNVNIKELDYDKTNVNVTSLLSQNRLINYTSNNIPNKVVNFFKQNTKLFTYDFSDAALYFNAVQLNITNGNVDLTFMYNKQSTPLAVGSTMILDPTFGYTTASNVVRVYTNSGTGTSCPSVSSSDSAASQIQVPLSTDNNICIIMAYQWDISSIPTNATISSVKLDFGSTVTSSGRNCDFTSETAHKPTTATASQLWTDITSPTHTYVSNNATCTTSTNANFTLGANAVTDAQSQLSSGWFAVGWKVNNMTRDATHESKYIQSGANTHRSLQIVYSYVPGAPTLNAPTVASNSSINVSWTTSTGASWYLEKRESPVGGGFSTVINTTSTSHTDTGLTAGHQYNYKIVAGTNSGTSADSNQKSLYLASSTTGTITKTNGTVGDVIQINATYHPSSGVPNPIAVAQYIIVNGTVVDIITGNHTILNNYTFPAMWHQFASNHTEAIAIKIKMTNYTGTPFESYVNITGSSFNANREYGPDYFTAKDASQGQVNYTYDGTNFKVNRNNAPNGTVWKIECQYLSWSDAFFNNTSGGTWDNQTNHGYYIHALTRPTTNYYTSCWNDGLLFSGALITGNSTNYIIPGLVIFDQLGGFLGAPSVLIFVLAILSWGTGRNFPMVITIAVSALGIMAALGLLILNGAYWPIIFVVAGLAIFGIRKFY